jgi:predicted TIM-barrel fold metal-dependent hydrolase
MPTDIGVFDTLIGLPSLGRSSASDHPAGYLFPSPPDVRRNDDSVTALLDEMDKYGIEHGLVPVSFDDELSIAAVRDHPDRLHGSLMVDPNLGMAAVRDLRRAVEDVGVVAAQFMPAGVEPAVPINDKRAYPIYSACIDLDIPIFVNGGVPGPRVPMDSQYPGLVDEVCWFFPELRFVFRHGCEPWEELTVKLLVKWENLYYSTTAFAPRYYPKAIIDYANRRGADKILYGGYYPYGLELQRIFAELPDVPLKDDVWPKFLRHNALAVLKLGG